MRNLKAGEKIYPLFQAGLEFQNTFQKLRWSFYFIGSLAVIRWGEIRMTQDIDSLVYCADLEMKKILLICY